MRRAVLKSYVLLLVTLALVSCHRGRSVKMGPVTGKSNEIVIVIGKETWKGESGAFMRDILARSQFPLTESKPVFSLIDVPPEAFINQFKCHRNIITVKISSTFTEPKVEYTHDIWAYPQAVVNIEASSADNFKELFTSNSEKIINYFQNSVKHSPQ